MDRGTEKGEKIMKRLVDNLKKKNKYYNELFKITSGMIYDIQNSGREAEFEMLVEKRAQVIKSIDALDAERRKTVAGFDASKQPHIKALLLCREKPQNELERAVYMIAEENRKILRKIMTYNNNLNMQVKIFMSKAKV